MSGELQTIPARHGVATFVPRGRTIKIINTYGKQVVSTWAFSLAAPPEEGDEDEELDEDEIEEKTKELKEEASQSEAKAKEEKPQDTDKSNAKTKGVEKKVAKDVEKPKEDAKKGEKGEKGESSQKQEPDEGADDPPEQAPDSPEDEKSTKTTEQKKQPEKRTWGSYLPSMPYRSKGAAAKNTSKPDPKAEKAQNEATSKKWSSYFPTGKSFSSYVPNVQVPDSKEVVSTFKASIARDPNKSYAEQLYDFSKTPVGAGSIAAATGGGTASSLYAAYNAYTKMNPSKSDQPPMEYLSLPHTRAFSHRLVPEVDDTLLTNLRSPIMTLIEDTTPGGHDTLTAACDANQYATLGVKKPEEHGSCAENLVLALKELNEKAGLKGTKAVGADITVNIAPTPLHLFMNAPIELDNSAQSEGSGARGAKVKIDEPNGKKRSYVRFRAERDIVIVMSACPMDVGSQNGGKCMATNFMVEEASGEELAASTKSLKKPKKLTRQGTAKKEEEKEEPKSMPKPRGGPAKIAGVKQSAESGRKDSAAGESQPAKADGKAGKKGESKPEEEKGDSKPEEKKVESKPKEKKGESKPEEKKGESQPEEKKGESKPEEKKDEETPTPKKKPKKIQRRSEGATPSA